MSIHQSMIAGMPALERAQHRAILGETDVVRDLGRVIDVDFDVHSTGSCSLTPVVVSNDRLLAGAVALERALFADRVGALEDPVLPGGQPGKDFRFHGLRVRRSADWLRGRSAPSGEKLARSSRKTRTSSSQSMSSSAKVTSPSCSRAPRRRASVPISAFACIEIGRVGEEAARRAATARSTSDRRRNSTSASASAAGGLLSPSRWPISM